MRWPLLPFVLLALLTAAPLRGQDAPPDDQAGAAPEGALFLLLPVGSQGVAMGRAMTAAEGPESVWWNPAGLASVRERRFHAFRGDHPVAGEATAVAFMAGDEAAGAFALAYQLIDVGEVDVTDNQGNVVGELSSRNHLGIVSLATQLWDQLSLGVNFKIVQARFACRGQCTDAGVTATTFAVDAGVQVASVVGTPLRLGAMVAHAGRDFQIVNEEQADPLPTRIRVAAAYEVLGHFVDTDELGMSVSVELEDRLRDPGSPATYVGTELFAGKTDALYVRAGYVFGADLQVDGASVGVGLRYERFDLGLAKSLASSILTTETEPVHISFGLVF